MHKQPPETVDLPRKQPKQEPLDIALQGFYYSSLLLIIFIAVMCLLFEAIDIILT